MAVDFGLKQIEPTDPLPFEQNSCACTETSSGSKDVEVRLAAATAEKTSTMADFL
jgi:hypothetical protein